MRIQTNVTAMNTHRMYTLNNNNVSKSAEKLSSGYRINRAGDDAAGLAISEKMRAQVKGLSMASKNSQDAISLIQTAEGALQEVHTMLQRMNELSVQSATGTNANFDRAQIDAEFSQLKNEIDDIAKTTNFNDMKLLDGSLASDEAGVDVDSASKMAVGSKIGTDFTITNQTGLSNQVGTYKISDKAADGTTALGGNNIRVEFTDAETGNVTNTTIDLDKAITKGTVAAGEAFTVDLSASGMGSFEMTALGAGTASDMAGLKAALVGTSDPTSKSALVTSAAATGDSAGAVGKMVGTKAGVKAIAEETDSFKVSLAGVSGQTTADNDVYTLTFKDKANNDVVFTSAAVTDNTATPTQIGTAFDGKTATVGSTTYTISNAAGVLTISAGAAGAVDGANAIDTSKDFVLVNGKASHGTSAQDSEPTSAAATDIVAGVTGVSAVAGEATFTADVNAVQDGSKLTVDGQTYVFRTAGGEADAESGEQLIQLTAGMTNTQFATAIHNAIGGTTKGGNYTETDGNNGVLTFKQATGKETNASTADMKGIVTFKAGSGAAGAATVKGGLKIQVGAEEGDQLNISIAKMNSAGLGLTAISIGDQEKASAAITATRNAINTVSEQRAVLGAMQNRLDYKISNLDNTVENLSAAESRIRDVDLAKEMTSYTKNNILSQASTAMLAQANAAPQNVLSLLQ